MGVGVQGEVGPVYAVRGTHVVVTTCNDYDNDNNDDNNDDNNEKY